MQAPEHERTSAFGEEEPHSTIIWARSLLLPRSIRRAVGTFAGKRVGDFGCGYRAPFVRPYLPVVAAATLVDIALAEELKEHPKVEAYEGVLPDALGKLPSDSLDVILCISSLEHLLEPAETLLECRRLLAPGGVLVINVPTWFAQRLLELCTFRLGFNIADEIDDHKMYYDRRDLWPLLRQAGFLPRNISCRSYPFGLGLTTFAVCRV